MNKVQRLIKAILWGIAAMFAVLLFGEKYDEEKWLK